MKLLPAALLLLLATPAAAHAATPRMVARDVPLTAAQRQLSGVAAPRFNMLGLHWEGRGGVAFRTRSIAGRWSGWRAADAEDDSRPDSGTAEHSLSGWRLGSPVWTGPSDRLQVRTRGAVRRVRAFYLSSPVEKAPPRALSLASSPPIISRLAWGADESIRRAAPLYASSLHFAVVHHTAGTNSYTKAESAAIVRGIERYHVLGNGWNDIGYNFLVDKYGQIFEGRWGGIDRNVVGAHAGGFNTGSVGVSVLGNYGSTSISAAARDALVRLLVWRLDVGHVDPLSTLTWPSGGNGKFPAGVPVFMRAISGHRDTGFTDCPGNALYARLNDIAAQVAQTGLPKLYTPQASGAVGGPVRFTGLLTTALPWTVTVTDAAGNRMASGSGLGTAIDWTWDATGVSQGSYAWSMDAGPTVLPAHGTIGKAATLSLTGLVADSPVITPNADGDHDTGAVSFNLGAPATVTAQILDAQGGIFTTLLSAPRPAGPNRLVINADALPDGAYTLAVTAQSGTKVARARITIRVNRTLGFVASSAAVFSPNGDGRLDSVRFSFLLTYPATVKVRVLRGERWVTTLMNGPLGEGTQTADWDGRKPGGRLLDGPLTVDVTATNDRGSVSQRAPFVADTTPPALRLFSLHPLRVRVWEPVRLAVMLNGRWSTIDRKRPGLVPLGNPTVIRTLRVVARDAAGNASAPVALSR